MFAANAHPPVQTQSRVSAETQDGRKDANAATVKAQAVFAQRAQNNLELSDEYLARLLHNRIAKPSFPNITTPDGRVVWTFNEDAVLQKRCPPSANPSLWLRSKVNSISGLFKVVDGIYQIRGFDCTSMTIVEGVSGLIVIDPVYSCECAKAGLEFFYSNIGRRSPVKAVIYSHSHGDHFAGAGGIITQKAVDDGEVEVYAPDGFVEGVRGETFLPGNAMRRRAMYQFGIGMADDEKGVFDFGISSHLSTGTVSFIPPTHLITKEPIERVTVDGVHIEFQLAQNTEATAEMNFYFPDFKVMDVPEMATHTMHHLLTPRGAPVRDPKVWIAKLDECIKHFAHRSNVLITQHGYPTFGRKELVCFLCDHRDMLRYMHDQTFVLPNQIMLLGVAQAESRCSVRLINKGYTPLDIAEELQDLPPGLAKQPHCRPYYGTTHFAARAIYQLYMGFHDGNPSTLHPLPPRHAASKYVKLAGGMSNMLSQVRTAFEADDLRWASDLGRHAVYAEPANHEARCLLADIYEQLGYRSENGPWRASYLRGAHELRTGISGVSDMARLRNVAKDFDSTESFAYLSIRIKGLEAALLGNLTIIYDVDDGRIRHNVSLRNGCLTIDGGAEANELGIENHIVLQSSVMTLAELCLGLASFDALLVAGRITCSSGNVDQAKELFACCEDAFQPMFSIITPVDR